MRKVADISTGNGSSYPPAGKHLCRCIEAETWVSPNKKTPAVRLTFTTPDALYQFDDLVFVTAKALGRLALVAKRLCSMEPTIEIPDDDLAAAKQLARYIHDNAKGQDAILTIEAQEEEYMVTEGPDMGQVKKKTRHRVAFSGYERPIGTEQETPAGGDSEDDIPF